MAMEKLESKGWYITSKYEAYTANAQVNDIRCALDYGEPAAN